MCIANNHPWMIFSAYTFDGWFKKSIDPRRQNWPFHSSNSNNFATSLIPLTPPFKGFVRFIRFASLHSLRFTSFVSLCFIRFALLCFTSFTSLRSVRRCLTPLASLIPFASLRFTHSASLHSFRFTPLISLTSPSQVSLRSIYEVSSLFPFDSFHYETLRLESYLIWKRQIFFWWRLNHLNLNL